MLDRLGIFKVLQNWILELDLIKPLSGTFIQKEMRSEKDMDILNFFPGIGNL